MAAPIGAAAAVATLPPAESDVRPLTGSPLPPLDDTAETQPDTVESLAEAVSRRAQLGILRQQSLQQDLQLRLDRMRNDFNAAQEMRTEQLREMNALRDMAVEQGKKDDEILKKYIALI